MTRVKMQDVLGDLYSKENARLYKLGWTLSEIRKGSEYHEAGFALDFFDVTGRECSRSSDNLQNREPRYSQTRLDL